MSTRINRRDFLLSLIALGAGYALPKNAPAQIVDEVWQTASDDPWYFAVDQWGTIYVPDYPEDETWDDVFNIYPAGMRTVGDVINEVDACPPLALHIQELAEQQANQLEQLLKDRQISDPLLRRNAKKVVAAIRSDPDFGWQRWIELEGQTGVARAREAIAHWLAEPVDHSYSEFFPVNHGCQGQAKAFFETMDYDTLEELGIVIVEGEHPGSTYYAAELRRDVYEANAVAERMGLPFRFTSESLY